MLLFLDHGIFYEFMPLEEYGKDEPRTIGLKDVEPHQQYAPVISTNGGLWRYLIGDTIEFTSLKPFRIKVSGRLKLYINAFGEELIIDNAERAMAATCQLTGAHQWLIEFEKEPEDIRAFAHILDEELKKQNSDYEAKRHKGIALREPVIERLPRGTFSKWLRDKNKLGGQHKIPRLSNDRKIVEEILKMLEIQ
jgi:hypothetical protein